MLKIEDVLEILSIPLLGIIPESEEVLRASNLGSPVTLANPASAPARAYTDAARRLTRRDRGDDHPERQEEPLRQAVRAEGGMNLLELLHAGAARRRSRATGCRSCSRMSAPIAGQLGPRRDPARGDPRRDRQARHGRRATRCRSRWTAATSVSTLEVDIEIPTPSQAELALSA